MRGKDEKRDNYLLSFNCLIAKGLGMLLYSSLVPGSSHTLLSCSFQDNGGMPPGMAPGVDPGYHPGVDDFLSEDAQFV